VIEARVQQAGGTPREETALERAQRIEREIVVEEARKNFLHSDQGVKAANIEVAVLFDELERLSDEISAGSKELAFKKERNVAGFVLSTSGFSLLVAWSLQYANTLRDSCLLTQLWKGFFIPISGRAVRITSREAKLLKEMKYDLDRKITGEFVWRRLNGERRFFPTAQLAQECMKILLDQVRDMRLRGLETYFS